MLPFSLTILTLIYINRIVWRSAQVLVGLIYHRFYHSSISLAPFTPVVYNPLTKSGFPLSTIPSTTIPYTSQMKCSNVHLEVLTKSSVTVSLLLLLSGRLLISSRKQGSLFQPFSTCTKLWTLTE